MRRVGKTVLSHTAWGGQITRSRGRNRAMSTIVVMTSMLILVLLAHVARTQEMAVPVSIQVPLLMKVMSADRNLAERSGSELVIGVFYQPRFRASAATMEAFIEAAGSTLASPIAGQPVRVLPVLIEGEPDWNALIVSNELDVCYIAPLRALGFADLLPAAQAHQAITCTGVPEFVEAGLAIGFDSRGGKPQIVINIDAARGEGIDFSSQLLKLARIVKKD